MIGLLFISSPIVVKTPAIPAPVICDTSGISDLAVKAGCLIPFDNPEESGGYEVFFFSFLLRLP